MGLINKPNDVIEALDRIDWFSAIGEPLINIAQNVKINIVEIEAEAAKRWLDPNFEEARAVAWEAFRQILVKDNNLYKIWENYYKICNKKVLDSISNSFLSNKLVKSIGQNITDFSSQLPFVGAIGELLIIDSHPDWKFNLSQIQFYQNGHWVCGWEGILSDSEFIYPEPNYFVY